MKLNMSFQNRCAMVIWFILYFIIIKHSVTPSCAPIGKIWIHFVSSLGFLKFFNQNYRWHLNIHCKHPSVACANICHLQSCISPNFLIFYIFSNSALPFMEVSIISHFSCWWIPLHKARLFPPVSSPCEAKLTGCWLQLYLPYQTQDW